MSGEEDPAKRRRHLGRGLGALFGEEDEYAPLEQMRPSRSLALDLIAPNPQQPRQRFEAEEMAELIESVRQQGILQPILVRPHPEEDDRFQIVAGERRWRAAQAAQLHEVPVVIRDLSDHEVLQISLIENVQRENLSALEEAEGYQRLIDEFGHTQEDLAQAVGKSRSHVANTIRLLGLPSEVRWMLQERRLTAGHGRALLACEDPVSAAQEADRLGLNVRQTEALARGGPPRRSRSRGDDGSSGARAGSSVEKGPDILALEREVSGLLGLHVVIDQRDALTGNVRVEYRSLEQLDQVLQRLSQGRDGSL